MAAEHLMAIDAGTGSVRAIVFDAELRPLGQVSREYSHPPVPGHPGGQSFDTERNWKLTCECVQGVLEQTGISPDSIAAVSATSMREGLVLYDGEGREIWACPNSDSRAPAESTKLIEDGSAERIYELAGDWIAITAPPRLLWIKRHEPEIFASARHLTMLSDWILYRLSSEFVTDPTIGSSSAMFDLAKRDWSPDIVGMCELDPAILPDVVEPGTKIGAVTEEAAAQTGLAPGTPVVVGGADTQLGILGLGLSEPGACAILGGTFWQTTLLLDRPLVDPDRRLRTLCHVDPGRWMVEGIGFWCGLSMRWLRDAFFPDECSKAESDGSDPYVAMERLAEGVPPGANGVFGLFSDVMNAAHWVHAAPSFVGFDVTSPESSGRAECVRALEEAAAYVARGHLEMLERLSGDSIERATFAGGAAKARLWPQIVADVTGRELSIPPTQESTALGAAACAAVGAGIFADLKAATTALPEHEVHVKPDPEAAAAYDDLYRAWQALYEHQREAVDRGLLPPMWRAAGTDTASPLAPVTETQ